MGHLSIDRSPHMHFPLMLHYQSSIYLLVERWYDNYHDEAYLAAISDVPVCNTRSTRRPVLWPWWLPTPEQGEDEKLSWELVMTRPDIFDLIDLRAHTQTGAHTSTPTHMYKHEGQRKRKRRSTQTPLSNRSRQALSRCQEMWSSYSLLPGGMISNDFNTPLTFRLLPLIGQTFSLTNKQKMAEVLWNLPWIFKVPRGGMVFRRNSVIPEMSPSA